MNVAKKLTLEESVNKQIEAANERHETALRRQAERLKGVMEQADDNFSVLCTECFADAIVSTVAGEILLRMTRQVEQTLSGKSIASMEPPECTIIVTEGEMDDLGETFGYQDRRHRYFDITGVNFSQLLNRRLTEAYRRGLIPRCEYDGWEIYILGDDKSTK